MGLEGDRNGMGMKQGIMERNTTPVVSNLPASVLSADSTLLEIKLKITSSDQYASFMRNAIWHEMSWTMVIWVSKEGNWSDEVI